MNKAYLSISLFLGLSWFSSCSPEPTNEPEDYDHVRSLVEVEELKGLLGMEGVVLFDVRRPEEYDSNHIPGSINVWRTDFQRTDHPYGGMRLSRTGLVELLGNLGVREDDRVILYDAKAGVNAARLWWLMTIYGHTEAALLNGGIQSWSTDGNPTTAIKPPIHRSAYRFPNEGLMQLLIEKAEVSNIMFDTSSIILDVRSSPEYLGTVTKSGGSRPGRIPGSENLDWSATVNLGGDNKFKTESELIAILEANGLDQNKRIVTYCHTGVRSAHMTFVLTQLLNYQSVSNYDGSWTEWSFYEELPTEVGSEIL